MGMASKGAESARTARREFPLAAMLKSPTAIVKKLLNSPQVAAISRVRRLSTSIVPSASFDSHRATASLHSPVP